MTISPMSPATASLGGVPSAKSKAAQQPQFSGSTDSYASAGKTPRAKSQMVGIDGLFSGAMNLLAMPFQLGAGLLHGASNLIGAIPGLGFLWNYTGGAIINTGLKLFGL